MIRLYTLLAAAAVFTVVLVRPAHASDDAILWDDPTVRAVSGDEHADDVGPAYKETPDDAWRDENGMWQHQDTPDRDDDLEDGDEGGDEQAPPDESEPDSGTDGELQSAESNELPSPEHEAAPAMGVEKGLGMPGTGLERSGKPTGSRPRPATGAGVERSGAKAKPKLTPR